MKIFVTQDLVLSANPVVLTTLNLHSYHYIQTSRNPIPQLLTCVLKTKGHCI